MRRHVKLSKMHTHANNLPAPKEVKWRLWQSSFHLPVGCHIHRNIQLALILLIYNTAGLHALISVWTWQLHSTRRAWGYWWYIHHRLCLNQFPNMVHSFWNSDTVECFKYSLNEFQLLIISVCACVLRRKLCIEQISFFYLLCMRSNPNFS